jgi:5-methylcytosine-specific restriction enzyme A
LPHDRADAVGQYLVLGETLFGGSARGSMKIEDLPNPVTAAKADWLAGTRWLGFTPRSSALSARESCRAAINAQFGSGYVLEYVTLTFGDVNPAFRADPRYLDEREAHQKLAGRLIAVHRLRASPRPLVQIVGEDEYSRIQDMWAEAGKRYRWSVAFPIVESYAIIDQPMANEVFDRTAMQRLFGHPSGTLRPLIEIERTQIADLAIKIKHTQSAWIGIEDDIAKAEGSQIDPATERAINHDLNQSAPEGMTDEQWRKVRKRAAWLADLYARQRKRDNQLVCDNCDFSAVTAAAGTPIAPRALLDVHHMNPLDEGVRVTNFSDLCLVCPTCHRFMRAHARRLSDPVAKKAALRPKRR